MIVQFKHFFDVEGYPFTINPCHVESVAQNAVPEKTVTIRTVSGDVFIVEGTVSTITSQLHLT